LLSDAAEREMGIKPISSWHFPTYVISGLSPLPHMETNYASKKKEKF
jgi:hypothetical protein